MSSRVLVKPKKVGPERLQNKNAEHEHFLWFDLGLTWSRLLNGVLWLWHTEKNAAWERPGVFDEGLTFDIYKADRKLLMDFYYYQMN